MSPSFAREPFVAAADHPQRMMVLDKGPFSLQKRLEIIASAKKSIEVEFYIYNIDNSGRVFTQALIRKARQGVKVRVLVDYLWPAAHLSPYFANAMIQNGVEVRYYNPVFFLNLSMVNYRDHRKMVVVDDRVSITGGRNIADGYFDMDPDFNFADRDVLMEGDLNIPLRESFDRFWDSPMTRKPKPLKKGLWNSLPLFKYYKHNVAKAQDYITESARDQRLLASLAIAGKSDPQISHLCGQTYFVSDLPGKGQDKRLSYERIKTEFLTAKKSVHYESPYFIPDERAKAPLLKLLDRKTEVKIYANSMRASDDVFTNGGFFSRVGALIRRGMDVFVYRNGERGAHTKTVIIDRKTVILGSFNADPRSRDLNTEMALICRDNPELAADVLGKIQERERLSVRLNDHGDPADGSSLFHEVPLPKRLMYYMARPFSDLFLSWL